MVISCQRTTAFEDPLDVSVKNSLCSVHEFILILLLYGHLMRIHNHFKNIIFWMVKNKRKRVAVSNSKRKIKFLMQIVPHLVLGLILFHFYREASQIIRVRNILLFSGTNFYWNLMNLEYIKRSKNRITFPSQ